MFRTVCFVLFISLAAVILCENARSAVNLESNTRITYAPRAHLAQFPFHALLVVQYRNDNTNRLTYCGGAILNELWFLATADCITNARTIRIELGTVQLTRLPVTVYPELSVIHPQYDVNRFRNNLALLRLPLNRPLYFPSGPNPSYYPVRLPSLRQLNATFEGEDTYFTGFGYTTANSYNISEYLFYSEQKVVSNRECLSHYDGDTQLISPSVVCALSYDIRRGPCNGDGGAPMVINEFGSWTLVGTLSFLHARGSCGRTVAPAAFTRLTSHLDWISRTANYHLRP